MLWISKSGQRDDRSGQKDPGGQPKRCGGLLELKKRAKVVVIPPERPRREAKEVLAGSRSSKSGQRDDRSGQKDPGGQPKRCGGLLELKKRAKVVVIPPERPRREAKEVWRAS